MRVDYRMNTFVDVKATQNILVYRMCVHAQRLVSLSGYLDFLSVIIVITKCKQWRQIIYKYPNITSMTLFANNFDIQIRYIHYMIFFNKITWRAVFYMYIFHTSKGVFVSMYYARLALVITMHWRISGETMINSFSVWVSCVCWVTSCRSHASVSCTVRS